MLEGNQGDVPAPLTNLRHGQLFFGYPVIPYVPPPSMSPTQGSSTDGPAPFAGGGTTLSGRRIPPSTEAGSQGGSTSAPAPAADPASAHTWGTGGQALGSAARPAGASGLKTKKKKKARQEVIEIDD